MSTAAFQLLKKVSLAEETYSEYDGIYYDQSHGVDVAASSCRSGDL